MRDIEIGELLDSKEEMCLASMYDRIVCDVLPKHQSMTMSIWAESKTSKSQVRVIEWCITLSLKSSMLHLSFLSVALALFFLHAPMHAFIQLIAGSTNGFQQCKPFWNSKSTYHQQKLPYTKFSSETNIISTL